MKNLTKKTLATLVVFILCLMSCTSFAEVEELYTLEESICYLERATNIPEWGIYGSKSAMCEEQYFDFSVPFLDRVYGIEVLERNNFMAAKEDLDWLANNIQVAVDEAMYLGMVDVERYLVKELGEMEVGVSVVFSPEDPSYFQLEGENEDKTLKMEIPNQMWQFDDENDGFLIKLSFVREFIDEWNK